MAMVGTTVALPCSFLSMRNGLWCIDLERQKKIMLLVLLRLVTIWKSTKVRCKIGQKSCYYSATDCATEAISSSKKGISYVVADISLRWWRYLLCIKGDIPYKVKRLSLQGWKPILAGSRCRLNFLAPTPKMVCTYSQNTLRLCPKWKRLFFSDLQIDFLVHDQ